MHADLYEEASAKWQIKSI